MITISTTRCLSAHRVRLPSLILAITALLSVEGCSTSEAPAPNADAGQLLSGPDAQTSDPTCDTTWKAIQKTIFQGDGCTSSKCHSGDQPAGGLNLEGDAALDQLLFQKPQASITSPMYLIQPGEQALSFLYLKTEAATEGTALPPGGGAPMPFGLTPISADHLSALRLWIRAGAPRTGVVAGTQGLLLCTLSVSADPNKAPRPPVPAADEGFQQVAGPWALEANSENEVCFATYYDLTTAAPDWSKLPCDLPGGSRTCVGFKRRQLSQDAQSHHSIISIYTGAAATSDPAWGAWRCAGGALEGTTCDPTKLGQPAAQGGADCGDGAVCQSVPTKATACRGWGPNDKDTNQIGAGGAQSPVSSNDYPAGVYGQIPLQGVIIWNSHGFNLTTEPTTIEQYNTFWYAKPEERQYLVKGIFDTHNIFVMNVPPFEQREYCATFTLPQYAHLSELGSHAHKRGVLWRTWLPPNSPDCSSTTCAPNDGVPAYLSRVYNDPLVLRFDPSMSFDDPDPGTRTLKYCSVYDNGKDDPTLVKRKSTLPAGASPCTNDQLACVGGEHQGQLCGGDDTVCGTGLCDACPVRGGVTTEDEMFILLGNYYVVPPAP